MTENDLKENAESSPEIIVKNGDSVSVDYIGKLEDGTVFDTSIKEAAVEAGKFSEQRNYEPLSFTVGAGQMIKGFDLGVVGMKVGEEKTLAIPPEEAYGEYTEELAKEIPLSAVDFKPVIGTQLMTDTGARGTVTSVGAENFVVDFNHELAGKTLIFKVTLVAVNEV